MDTRIVFYEYGPVYRSFSIDDGRATLRFDTSDSELSSWYRDPLKGFAIAGQDRKWVWAGTRRGTL